MRVIRWHPNNKWGWPVDHRTQSCRGNRLIVRLAAGAALLTPGAAFAQASPFDTGANSLVTFALTIATPVAVLIVIALAVAAAVGRISWGWVIGALIGIAAIFGAPQIVAWIRTLFGV